jgi:hypothetical protein
MSIPLCGESDTDNPDRDNDVSGMEKIKGDHSSLFVKATPRRHKLKRFG